MTERRSRERCELCQGPTKLVSEGLYRCRNSLCLSHFKGIKCPRCGETKVYPRGLKGKEMELQCPSCDHLWNLAEG